MGLLDPNILALLQAAGTGLQASGPSRTPVSMGQIMGHGLLSGVNAYQQGTQQQMQNRLGEAQLTNLGLQNKVGEANLAYTEQQRQQAEALARARAGIFGDPGVTPEMALAGGGGPTNDNAAKLRPANPMALNPLGVQRYLAMPGADPRLIEAFKNLGPEGKVDKINPKDYTPESFQAFISGGGLGALIPARRRDVVETTDANGNPVTSFVDMYSPPTNSMPKPVRQEAVNAGGQTVFRNPYAQNGPIQHTLTPDALLSDQRAGLTYDTERGMVVNTRAGTASPVMAGSQPLGPKPEKLGEAQVKQLTGVNNLKNAIAEYRSALKDFSILDSMTPNGRAKMGTMYNNMMLQAKEAYNLGVLNGPDYTILQSVVRDPSSGVGMITNNSALDKQAAELDRIMTQIGATTAAATKTPKPQAGDIVPQAGDIVDGYLFKGGDLASPSSWEKS